MSTTPLNASAVSAQISKLVEESTPSVREAYVKAQTEKEIANRVTTLATALDKLKSLKQELNKIRPDNKAVQVSKDANNQEVRTTIETYSPELLKKKDELTDKVVKLDNAITDYLSEKKVDDPNKDPYKVLKDLLGKLG